MITFLVGCVLGSLAGIMIMAILSGRLDDRMEMKKRKGR